MSAAEGESHGSVTYEALAPEAADAPTPRAARAEPPVSEAVARAVLADHFRQAGYRIRYDVHIEEPGRFTLTVDGYDPRQRVGYEYIAADESGTDLLAAERTFLESQSELAILIVEPQSAAELSRTARDFLGRVASAAAHRE